jgi:hypothetical protein
MVGEEVEKTESSQRFIPTLARMHMSELPVSKLSVSDCDYAEPVHMF